MKNKPKFFGRRGAKPCVVAFLVVAIGFSMVGCSVDSAVPTVTRVTINPASVNIARGGTLEFAALVEGNNDPWQDVEWSIVETDRHEQTWINRSGFLSVAYAETLEMLTVQATSMLDISRIGTATVAIIDAPPLSGTVHITGNAIVGETLTVNTDNLGGLGAISFEWRQTGEIAVIGTGSTFTVRQPDLGRTIIVTATRVGNPGSVTSLPTASATGTLAQQLAWLYNHAESYNAYLVEISADETPLTSLPSDRSNLTITLRGSGAMRTINSGFHVRAGVTLILDSNITLQGRDDGPMALVRVGDRGTLIMNAEAKIIGNNNTGGWLSYGGGVHVDYGGIFIMHGGVISGNTAIGNRWDNLSGGGVHNQGIFTMHNGAISGNSSRIGAGVYNQGVFTMRGGEISSNTATATTANHIGYTGGGGVRNRGTFRMYGGSISGNTAHAGGGGVFNQGTFTMQGGSISNNSIVGAGGIGVLSNEGAFNMYGGNISLNTGNETSGIIGGGVLITGGAFNMYGGSISRNAANAGGGVGIMGEVVFTMYSGEILNNAAIICDTGNFPGVNGNGGGILVYHHALFNMQGGAISGNTAERGGGVYISWFLGAFYMHGGTISGNTANSGGGVYAWSLFRMTGGVIHGVGTGILANLANTGAVLVSYYRGEYGNTISGTFVPLGNLATTDNTIRVANGVLQP